MRVSYLSIRNIWAKSVDHMNKIGCMIAVSLRLFPHGVRWIEELGFISVGGESGLHREGGRDPHLLCVFPRIVL